MPVHFTIDHDKRYVEARAEGETGLEDIEKFLDAVVVENALPYRKLFDGRLAIPKYVDLNNDVMMLGARMSAYASNLEPRGAAAFIVPDDAASDLAKRFINLAKVKHPVRIFLAEDKARKWLAAQPEI
jgi:hypothetical protein